MYKVHAVKKSDGKLNTWPPTSRPIRRPGRGGNPVVCTKVKARSR